MGGGGGGGGGGRRSRASLLDCKVYSDIYGSSNMAALYKKTHKNFLTITILQP